MSTYAYLDPTDNHDYNVQSFSILSFVSSRSLAPVHFCSESVQDHAHGCKSILSGMIDNLQREDVLLVTHFSTLGNSTVEVLQILSTLSRRGVKFYATNSGFRLDDNVQAQVVACAASLVSQIEEELNLGDGRVPVALKQKPPEGKTLGRPVGSFGRSKLDGRENEIKSLLAEGTSVASISRLMAVSRPALSDFIVSRRLSV